jgi:mono/diheme cytochrome c family protein
MYSGYKIVSAEIEGDGALVMHNGQTANPLNPYPKALKQVSGKRKKVDADHAAMAETDRRRHGKPRDTVRRRDAVVGIVALFAAMMGLAALGRASGEDVHATPIDYTKILPADLVRSTPKGKLVNPYKDTQADIVAQGAKLLQSYSCSGCHGGGGGGGMGPALTNDTWIYGGDDDTLFRLTALGSDELQKDGYSRIGSENVVGPMAPFGTLIKNSDDLWKILTFVRSKYSGDPAYKFGTPAETK